MAFNSAWGIDIGNRALKAIKLVRTGDGLRVDDFEIIEHESVLSNAGDNKEQLIQNALAAFCQRHQVKGAAVSVGVSGQSSFARFIKLPPVETKKIPEIVKFEAIQQIPFPLDDVEWSYQLFQDPESTDVEVGIFAMRKELVEQHIRYFTANELKVEAVQMNPLAVYNAMHFDGRLKGTTMIVDLGAENTDLIIADGETIWLRSIPIGGNNFTEALVKSFKLNFAKAEDLKRNAATSKYARQIFQAMRPVFADLVAEVQRSIGFYASVHRDARIKRIIALGGTFRLPGLQKYLQQNLQMDIERIDSLQGASIAEGKLGPALSENMLSMVGAYGLALQALGEGKITSSLLPQRIRRERLWKEKTPWFAAAAALFVLGTGLAIGRYQLQRMEFDSKADVRNEITQIKSRADQLDQDWSRIEAGSDKDRQQIVKIASLVEDRSLWTYILKDIHDSLPTPQPEVASGVVDDIKKIPRDKRNTITIDNMSFVYLNNVNAIMGDPSFTKHAEKKNTDAAGVQGVAGGKVAAAAGGGGGGGGERSDGSPPPGYGAPSMSGPPAGFIEEMQRLQGLGAGGGGGGGGAAAQGQSAVGGSVLSPEQAAVALSGPERRGLIVVMNITTPNALAHAFVSETLIKELLKRDQTFQEALKRDFYIHRAVIQSAQKVSANQNRLNGMRTAYTQVTAAQSPRKYPGRPPASAGGQAGGGVMSGGNTPPPGYGGPSSDPSMGGGFFNNPGAMYDRSGATATAKTVPLSEEKAYQDRLTGETVIDDYEIKLVVGIVLYPPPATPAPQASAQ